MVDARWNFDGNMKVGNIATWSTLASDRIFSTKYGNVQGTCAGCCEHCGHAEEDKKPPCYVFTSYRYPSVIDGHARNTISIRENPELTFQQLSDQLSRKRIPPVAARYDQSGEIETVEQHEGMDKCASDHPELPFYIYTKRYDVVIPRLQNGEVSDNFTHDISVWHEQGIEEFKKVEHLPNAKAFVYCDKNKKADGWGEEEYAEHGLKIQTWCMAYDTKGRMNHNVTCDVCKKCFDRNPKHKVIGCWDH